MPSSGRSSFPSQGWKKKKDIFALSRTSRRVSLEDLHSAESKGKWGASQPREVSQHDGGEPDIDDVSTAAALLKLARKRGMNTDSIRRSVFVVVLMSSDDYLDACERLAQLGLTEVQQRSPAS
ncbi:hypothetical protein F4604DRAFT_1226885 [Suillus subluteus]|nr:hypothetical protein F4604DRAFT_1226885 [Suillus subluteus]